MASINAAIFKLQYFTKMYMQWHLLPVNNSLSMNLYLVYHSCSGSRDFVEGTNRYSKLLGIGLKFLVFPFYEVSGSATVTHLFSSYKTRTCYPSATPPPPCNLKHFNTFPSLAIKLSLNEPSDTCFTSTHTYGRPHNSMPVRISIV